MKPIKHLVLVIAFTALSLGVSAAEDGYSHTYTSCMDATNGVTANMLNCMFTESEQQDTRLNQSYKAAMQVLGMELQAQLRDTQRLWIKFRDADCALLGSLTGGTIDSVNRASCFLDMTTKRADDLAWIAEQN